MKKLLAASGVLLVALACAYAQTRVRVFTSPKLPARDALERMNLVTAWHARVKVEGSRDGLFSVQVIPGMPNAQVVAQTYAGAVYLFDAENGDLVWKTHVGIAYWVPQPVGYNTQSIFTSRRNVLHVINRYTGAQRVYTADLKIKQAHFGYEMNGAPSTTLVADEDSLYVVMGDRVQTLDIPDFEAAARARLARGKLKDEKRAVPEPDVPETPNDDSPQPDFYWGYRLAIGSTEYPPIVDGDQVSIVTPEGVLYAVSRFGRGPRQDLFEFKTIGRVAAPAGQHSFRFEEGKPIPQPTAYIGSDDFNLYAVELRLGDLLWRHASTAPIRRKPEVNDSAVFISPERIGLRRLDRRTGREVWTNRDSTRFLAATHSVVYALDNIGKFFVIDGRRGTTLAKYDLTDWAIPVPNDMTDRIYLAANDGQILCLRNRDHAKPLTMKTLEGPAKKEEMKDPKKEEKKKDPEPDKMGLKSAPRAIARDVASASSAEAVGNERQTWAGR